MHLNHLSRHSWDFSFKNSEKMLFVDMPKSVDERLSAIDAEIAELNASLEGENDIAKRISVKDRIAELTEEEAKLNLIRLEKGDNSSALLLYGLENTLKTAQDREKQAKAILESGGIPDEDLSTLEAKTELVENALKNFKGDISNKEQMRDAVLDLGIYRDAISKIDEGNFQFDDIRKIAVGTDLGPFLSTTIGGEIQAAMQQIITSENVAMALYDERAERARQVDRDWKQHVDETNLTLAALEGLQAELSLQVLPENKGKRKRVLKKWAKGKRKLSALRDLWITDKLEAIVTSENPQAEFQHYIDIIKKSLEDRLTWQREHAIKIEKEQAQNKKLLQAVPPRTLEAVKNYLLQAIELKSGQLERNFTARHKKLQARFKELQAKGGMQVEDAEQLENFELYLSAEGLEILLAQLKPEEIDDRLKLAEQALDISSEEDSASVARKTIEALEKANNVTEVKEILSQNLTEGENLEYVSNGEFEAEYRKYTATGFMVFAESSEGHWKIIIDKDAIENDENFERVKNQLTHELLHLEFETDETLKRKTLDMLKKDTQKWDEIQRAFFAAVKGKFPPDYRGQGRPSLEDWKEEDIASELYAMQDIWREPYDENNKHPMNILRGLILTTPLGVMAHGAEAMASMFPEELMGMEDEYAEDNLRWEYHGAEENEENADDEMPSDAIGADSGGDEDNVEEGKKTPEEVIRDNQKIAEHIQRLETSEHKKHLPGVAGTLAGMKKYNENTLKLLKGNMTPGVLAAAAARNEKIEEDVKGIEQMLSEASENVGNERIDGFRKLMLRTSFMSIADVMELFKESYEYIGRRHQRRKQDHAARLGMALFKGTTWEHEARARQLKAEAEEVSEWEGRLENLDAWQLQEVVKKMATGPYQSPDQLKAVLRILAKKGRIDWRDKYLWITINKLQNAVHLSPEDEVLLHNPTMLRTKLHTAMGEIWDYDEFLSLERNNESSYQSEKEKYNPMLDKIQRNLTYHMDTLLKKFRNGENVDPQEYEAAIEYAIVNGKSNSETAMFHIIAGMAEGLIGPDRGQALDKHLNKWPATQWIFAQSPPWSQKDFMKLCNDEFKKDFDKGSVGPHFQNWYWTVLQNERMVIDRVRKSVSERDWDHDWGRAIAPLGDANTAKRFFSGRSGQAEAKDTGVANAYVGALQWLEENARNPKRIAPPEEFARQIAWVAMADGILDNTAYTGTGGIALTQPVRKNASMLGVVPRESGVTHHEDWNMQQFRNKMHRFLEHIDPTLFKLLRTEVRVEDDAKKTCNDVKQHIAKYYPELNMEVSKAKHVDDIFEKMDAIIQVVVASSVRNGTFQNALQFLVADIGQLK